MSTSNDSPGFEIALTMAGAVSAGAYTGGVVDFLLFALEEFYKKGDGLRRDENEAGPPHKVVVRGMTGTSAGGMTAATIVAALRKEFNSIRTAGNPDGLANTIYESWVEKVDLEHLLKTNDLPDRNAPLRSLLDSTIIDEIADDAIGQEGRAIRREYIHENLELKLCVTNLNGIHYNLKFEGEDRTRHSMSLHEDYMHFYFGEGHAKLDEAGAYHLDPAQGQSAPWEHLKAAAKATGAFPVGLAARYYEPNSKSYEEKNRPLASTVLDEKERAVCQPAPIKPDLPSDPLRFTAVDGGAMNNEPFDLARRMLANKPGENDPCARNPRSGTDANRAVLMVDPFPSKLKESEHQPIKDNLVDAVGRLITVFTNQSRFKAEDLALASDRSIRSRFIITPVRYERDANGERHAQPEEHAIACGSLGGFGGFLHRDYRDHDYQLGRRNCQQFLRKHFRLPATNQLFADWSDDAKAEFQADPAAGETPDTLPILPLVGEAAEEMPAVAWPRGVVAERNAEFKSAARKRLRAVLGAATYNAIQRLGFNAFWRELGYAGIWVLAWPIARVAVWVIFNTVKTRLRAHGELLKPKRPSRVWAFVKSFFFTKAARAEVEPVAPAEPAPSGT